MFNEKKVCVQPRRLEYQGLRCVGAARGEWPVSATEKFASIDESLVAITP
jgi:hypothetical protein